MQLDNGQPATSKAMLWIGYVISALCGLAFILSGVMKFSGGEEIVKGFDHLGWPLKLAIALGITEIVSAVLYLIPQTAVLGAVLLTGYVGGAIATHVRLEEEFIAPVVLGLMVWGGLWLRDSRIRALLPLHS